MKKWLIGVIVGVVLVALIIGGVVVYLSELKTKWKTYENKDWGFRIKYPVDLEIEKGEKGIGFYEEERWMGGVVCCVTSVFSVHVYDVSEDYSLNDCLQDIEKSPFISEILEVRNVTIGGVKGMLVKTKGLPPSSYTILPPDYSDLPPGVEPLPTHPPKTPALRKDEEINPPSVNAYVVYRRVLYSFKLVRGYIDMGYQMLDSLEFI
jgi:hypothetical protein